MTEWIDCGTYWLNTSDQRTTRWHDLRVRLTASNFGIAIGHSNFSTPEELADQIAGISKKSFTPEAIQRMGYGTQMEPVARQWYATTRGVEVNEVGIAIPKWDPMIGGSLDGNVGSDGCIEIKCVAKMYEPLKKRIANSTVSKDWSHIWKTHFDQMQGCMAITNKKWCDYVVFCPAEDQVYVERIPFQPEYWEKILYPGLRHFLEKLLLPRLDMKKVVMPPK